MIHRAWLWITVAALVVGCGRDRVARDRPAVEVDTTAPVDVGAVPPGITLELVSAGVDSSAASACDSVAAIFVETPDGLVEAGSDPVHDPDSGIDLPGCLVSLRGSLEAIGGAQRPDVGLGARFVAAGWGYDDRFAADGPDGTSFVLVRDDLFCIVEGQWDGGDDTDPRYVPPPDYLFEVRCANRSG